MTLLRDLLRCTFALPSVEAGRLREGIGPLVLRIRVRGRDALCRDEKRRDGLRRAIRLVDRVMPGGPNCYRRVLLEVALDAGAAREPINLGLMTSGKPKSGHAWLGDRRDSAVRYDAELAL